MGLGSFEGLARGKSLPGFTPEVLSRWVIASAGQDSIVRTLFEQVVRMILLILTKLKQSALLGSRLLLSKSRKRSLNLSKCVERRFNLRKRRKNRLTTGRRNAVVSHHEHKLTKILTLIESQSLR